MSPSAANTVRACRTSRAFRPGLSRTRVLAALACATLLVGGGWYALGRASSPALSAAPLTSPVTIGPFVHQVVEKGEVESSSNVEIRCEVRSRSSNGITILEIVPEGTYVQPGDFLVRLDDAALQTELIQQQIECNLSQANVIQAQTAVETSRLAKQEYESGTFKQEEEQLESELFVAEEDLRRSEEHLRYSQRLASKGYITPVQLEADQFAVEKARKELEVARTKITVLRTYTRDRLLMQYDSDIRNAEAKLQSAEENYQLDLADLQFVRDQIAKCVIVAPSQGQVVYANERSRHETDIDIEEGRQVRERQILIRLPDPKQMRVVAHINEARVDLVEPGMTTTVKLDALPGFVLTGTVRKVSEYPLSTSSFTSHVKEYATEIDIHDPPPGLRPGMTAEVAVQVEQLDNALQVPVQAVFERSGRHFCLLTGQMGQLIPRAVLIGATNERQVVIHHGLAENEAVVMSPHRYLDDVTLPEPTEAELAALPKPRRSSRAIEMAATVERPQTRVVKRVPTERSATVAATSGAGQ